MVYILAVKLYSSPQLLSRDVRGMGEGGAGGKGIIRRVGEKQNPGSVKSPRPS